MIYVDRVPLDAKEAPPQFAKLHDVLSKKLVASKVQAAKHFRQMRTSSGRQRRFEFENLNRFEAVMRSLASQFSGKCCYCESRLSGVASVAHIEQFRPTQNALGINDESSAIHYWWLAYEWENLYYVCQICNLTKGAKFPVAGRRARVGATGKKLDSEKRLLLDPCADRNPEQHLEFLPDGRVTPRTPMGKHTVEILALNRTPLVEARADHARRFLADLRLRPESAGEWFRADGEYLQLTKQLFAAQLRSPGGRKLEVPRNLHLPSPVAAAARAPADRRVPSKEPALSVQYLEHVRLENFRAMKELEVDFTTGDEVSSRGAGLWRMFLGENGHGKTSILYAIALTLAGERVRKELSDRHGISPQDVLRNGAAKGRVLLRTVGGREVELQFDGRKKQFESDPAEPRLMVLCYGPTRLPPARRGGSSDDGYSRAARAVANLFDPFKPLVDTEEWLANLPVRQFDFAVRTIKDVMALDGTSDQGIEFVRRKIKSGTEILIQARGRRPLPLASMSDAYRSLITLTADILRTLGERRGASTPKDAVAEQAIVLLDELGAYLHPRWRMRVVDRLRAAFPQIQFIATTHDPLCLRGVRNGEVTVLRRTGKRGEGTVFAVDALPPVEGLSVDQLLTSEFFGLSSTLDPMTEAKFQRLYQLKGLSRRTAKQDLEMQRLSAELAPIDLRGHTRRERMMLDAIDTFLAREMHEPEARRREELNKTMRKELAVALAPRLGARKRGGRS